MTEFDKSWDYNLRGGGRVEWSHLIAIPMGGILQVMATINWQMQGRGGGASPWHSWLLAAASHFIIVNLPFN